MVVMAKKLFAIILVVMLAFSLLMTAGYADGYASRRVSASLVNTQMLQKYGIDVSEVTGYSIEPVTVTSSLNGAQSGFALRVSTETPISDEVTLCTETFIVDVGIDTQSSKPVAALPTDLLNMPVARASGSDRYFRVTYNPTHTTHTLPSNRPGKAFRPSKITASYSPVTSGGTASKLNGWLHISGDLVKFPYEVIQDMDEWGFEFIQRSPVVGQSYSRSSSLPSGQYFHVYGGIYSYLAGANLEYTTNTGISDELRVSTVVYSY